MQKKTSPQNHPVFNEQRARFTKTGGKSKKLNEISKNLTCYRKMLITNKYVNVYFFNWHKQTTRT